MLQGNILWEVRYFTTGTNDEGKVINNEVLMAKYSRSVNTKDSNMKFNGTYQPI